jgi:acetolactate decarboxylase
MNKKNKILIGAVCTLLAIGGISAYMDGKNDHKETGPQESVTYPDVKIAGAMKNVMWKGELGSSIDLDSISEKNGLYGLGPKSYLTGEVLINNGKSYVSTVTSDSTMLVEETFDVTAPFLVYTNVTEWTEVEIPSAIKTIKELENFIDRETTHHKRPLAIKLTGKVASAKIHIQNLPKGTKVSSPEEAHQGQTSYGLENEEAEIIGFFSTQHQGIFTHHDSFLHMHLITKDKNKMGHLDELEIDKMTLYLPKK